MTLPNAGYAPWIIQGEDGIIVRQEGLRVRISGSGIPAVLGAVFQSQLASDESISTAPPTGSFLYGPGQPAVLLQLVAPTLRAGPTLIRGVFNGYLFNDDPDNENQPFVDVGLFVDGVQVARANQSFFFSAVDPSEITIMPFTGAIEARVTTAAVGALIELRWGVSGAGPHATASIPAGTAGAPNMNTTYATITAEELPLP